jgi:hypothetical protein
LKFLAFIELNSYGAALEAVNVLPNYESLELVEIVPLGGPTVVFLSGNFEMLNVYRRNLRTADLNKSHFFIYKERFLDIFYHKENRTPGKHILVLESDFVGNLFFSIEDQIDGLQVIDFQFNKHFQSKSILIVTASSEVELEKVIDKAQKKKVKITYFENPSSALLKLF